MGRFLRSVSTDTVDPRQYKNTQEFTAAGSYAFTVPAGVSRIRAIVVGAGGATRHAIVRDDDQSDSSTPTRAATCT